MIKDKLTKNRQKLSGRGSIEMGFTKGVRTASGSKLSQSKLTQN